MGQIDSIGRLLLFTGLGLAVVGGLILLAARLPFLQGFGSLPGNIRWQSPDGRFSCFAPIASMILISIVLTVILNLAIRLLNRP